MGAPDKQVIRLKIMGTLLRHARLSAGRSQAELAAALHVSRHHYAQYEHGKREISLPELQHVAELCGVPLGYFFDDEAEVEEETLEITHEVAPRIKRKILGSLLRQARQLAGKSQKECAELLGASIGLISQYEQGEKEISTAEIELLAPHLDVEPSYFTV
jgi:transcriptional regulator with XRE-family HTH domain